MAERWKIYIVAHANLLQHRSFPVLNAPSMNDDMPLRDKVLASGADDSVGEHTTDITNGLSDLISYHTKSLLP